MRSTAATTAGLCCVAPAVAPALGGPVSARTVAPAPAPTAHEHEHGVPVPAAGRPPDSDAPKGSAPHWLPHDTWVHLHWVPFDERRLQSSTGWSTRVRVRDMRTSSAIALPRSGAYEATLSGDGRRVAFTACSRSGERERLQVFLHDRTTRTTRLVSRIGRDAARAAEAWDPALSHDGSRIAFAATTVAGGRARVYVRDLGERTSRAVSGPHTGFTSEPAISADGRRIVFAELSREGGHSRTGRPAQRLLARDLPSGDVWQVSVAADGRRLGGWSGQPQLSADGSRIAYTTDAATPAGGPGGLRVYVTDLAPGTSRVASPAAPLGSFDTGAGALTPAKRLCSLVPPAW